MTLWCIKLRWCSDGFPEHYQSTLPVIAFQNITKHYQLYQMVTLPNGHRIERLGEGTGNPLQYSCLENPMDGGAWQAASPWGREESDTTEQLPFHVSLSCIGEGNGNPLQCSCLENPRDGGAWWAAVYGVAQGWTRLKRLSSSSITCFEISIH